MAADGAALAADRAAIDALLEEYLAALHECDSARLRQVLHPEALYATSSGGPLLTLRMDAYWRVLDARPSPASQGHPRQDRVERVEIIGPDTGLARVQCAAPPKHFDDVLSLVKVEGRWWVMAKVFHYDLDPSTPP